MAAKGTAAKKNQIKKKASVSEKTAYSGPDQKAQKPTIVHNPCARATVKPPQRLKQLDCDVKVVQPSVLG